MAMGCKLFFNKKFYFGFVYLILVGLTGCASEDPALVSPEPSSKTVHFRLLNYCSSPASLVLGETVESQSTPQNTMSQSIRPPLGDSMTLAVKQNGSVVYKMPIKFRLIRDTKYSMIALPKPENIDPEGRYDSLIYLSTSLSLMLNENKSYLTIVNAFPDSSVFFSATVGCPNGEVLALNSSYKSISAQTEIIFGKTSISLSKSQHGVTELVNLYDFDFVSKGEYALIIRPDDNKKPELWLLDMNNPEVSSLQKATVNVDRATFIRTLNFSDNSVKLNINNSLLGDFQNNSISDYVKYTSCQSTTQDIVSALTGSDTSSMAFATLEVNKKYSILVFDSAQKKSGLTIIANPIKLLAPLGNNCAIRVVHAAYLNGSLTLSMGARKDNSSIGYRSGEVLSSNVTYGNISKPAIVPAGRAPITLFTSDQPPQLLLPALPDYYLQPGKSYLLIITNDDKGFCKMTLIEEEVANTPLNESYQLKTGIFTQIIHANSGEGTLSFGIADITSAKVYYKGFLATVLPVGDNNITINNGLPLTFKIADTKERGLIIIGKNNQLFNKSTKPIGFGNGSWRIRFINISDAPVNCQIETFNYQETLDAGASSTTPYEYNLPGKVSINFADTVTKRSLYRLDGLEFSFGLNYSLIFTGNSAIQKSEY